MKTMHLAASAACLGVSALAASSSRHAGALSTVNHTSIDRGDPDPNIGAGSPGHVKTDSVGSTMTDDGSGGHASGAMTYYGPTSGDVDRSAAG